MNRWKILPHRLAGGRCRDCGQYDAYSAPENCPRCAFERFRDAGFFTILDPVSAFENQGRERWRTVAQQLRSGRIRSGRFHLFVGHDDGGPLEPVLPEVLPAGQVPVSDWSSDAYATATALTGRYPQVWVVTTIGCWSVSSGQ